MKRIIFFLIIVVFFAGCRERYELPLRDNDVALLVVEGVLNVGGPTSISLSRTVRINDTVDFKPELNAQLTVEDKNGGNFFLVENGFGQYTHNQLPLTAGQEYRLRIRTTNNHEYLSDYVVAQLTPDIDSISWKKDRDGIMIYANTHDPSNNTRYYKWDYDETWEIRSWFAARYKWLGGADIAEVGLQNYQCWKYNRSASILIGTTAQLQSDVMSEAPLTFIDPGTERLGIRYSILVRQQSLTKAAYEYLSMMKKNTESLGTIFDAQPSELRGNIHCVTNPAEDVVGYLTASSFSEKRLFITSGEANWRFVQECFRIEVPNHPDSIKEKVPSFLPYEAEGVPRITKYYFSTPPCIDCTARGGDLNRPSYW